MKIKGINDGILVELDEQNWVDSQTELFSKIDEKQAFFQGARLVLAVGSQALSAQEIEEVRKKLSKQDVQLFGIFSNNNATQKNAKSLGLEVESSFYTKKTDEKLEPLDTLISGEPALFLHRTMRSGYKISYQGHVVILGDVNPGAEIIASGSVVVWGRLRGTAHAGAEGDRDAVVCALDLSPMQLRIASKIATTPQDQEIPKPEMAKIVQDQIIAEPWELKKGDK